MRIRVRRLIPLALVFVVLTGTTAAFAGDEIRLRECEPDQTQLHLKLQDGSCQD